MSEGMDRSVSAGDKAFAGSTPVEPLQLGHYCLSGRVILAPMAGVTDAPFRQVCREYGAAHTVAEMVSANPRLRSSRQSRLRLAIDNDPLPRSIQIVGGDVESMVEAARYNVDRGAQVIDINMGCPAKKVCRKAAGSALMKDEALVEQILQAVVAAVDVPVTLKIRTGWSRSERNAVTIASIAEQAGVVALAVHGRSRECGYHGEVEYDTIRQVKNSVSIPVIANGDIDSPQQAAQVLDLTGADGVMIGRRAQGQPWLFRQIHEYLSHGRLVPEPGPQEKLETMFRHLLAVHQFYGPRQGVGMARKHFGWYCQVWGGEALAARKAFYALESTDQQSDLLHQLLVTGKVSGSSGSESRMVGDEDESRVFSEIRG